jgi:hypothetical protein
VLCATSAERQACEVKAPLQARLSNLGLELHPDKTRIVYCKDDDRRGSYEHMSFTFLGYTFQPRGRERAGKLRVSFLVARLPQHQLTTRVNARLLRLSRSGHNAQRGVRTESIVCASLLLVRTT